jgi:hypothetical protein
VLVGLVLLEQLPRVFQQLLHVRSLELLLIVGVVLELGVFFGADGAVERPRHGYDSRDVDLVRCQLRQTVYVEHRSHLSFEERLFGLIQGVLLVVKRGGVLGGLAVIRLLRLASRPFL